MPDFNDPQRGTGKSPSSLNGAKKNRSGDLLSSIADYYGDKLKTHGRTANGVDWNSEESQALRFDQLCRVVDDFSSLSINDIGCGYGAMYEYLQAKSGGLIYTGVDISADMVESARELYAGRQNAHFEVGNEPSQPADYSVASGIFNVRLSNSVEDWERYIEQAIEVLDRSSTRGFAFNCLTAYSDEHMKRDYLYYASPEALFGLCKRKYSPNAALLHDYGLYEFTVLVKK